MWFQGLRQPAGSVNRPLPQAGADPGRSVPGGPRPALDGTAGALHGRATDREADPPADRLRAPGGRPPATRDRARPVAHGAVRPDLGAAAPGHPGRAVPPVRGKPRAGPGAGHRGAPEGGAVEPDERRPGRGRAAHPRRAAVVLPAHRRDRTAAAAERSVRAPALPGSRQAERRPALADPRRLRGHRGARVRRGARAARRGLGGPRRRARQRASTPPSACGPPRPAPSSPPMPAALSDEELTRFGVAFHDEGPHEFDPAVAWWNESWF